MDFTIRYVVRFYIQRMSIFSFDFAVRDVLLYRYITCDSVTVTRTIIDREVRRIFGQFYETKFYRNRSAAFRRNAFYRCSRIYAQINKTFVNPLSLDDIQLRSLDRTLTYYQNHSLPRKRRTFSTRDREDIQRFSQYLRT